MINEEYISLDEAKATKKRLTKMLDNLNEAIYRIEESLMDTEEGKNASNFDWMWNECIQCIYRKCSRL